MGVNSAYKVTGFVVLVVGLLFFLRDMGVNLIGDTSGWTILLVLVGSAFLAGVPIKKQSLNMPAKKSK